MLIIDIIGWLGSAAVVIAYALNIAKKLSADSMAYFILNIVGVVFSSLTQFTTMPYHPLL